MSRVDVDLIIIGGGIHGAGVARDAARRGLSVSLFEQGDFASATSSASSKLVHGGLRYLEQLHLRLVRESLVERSALADRRHLPEQIGLEGARMWRERLPTTADRPYAGGSTARRVLTDLPRGR